MLMDCPKMSLYRESCELGPFIKAHKLVSPGISSIKLYARYLNDRDPASMKRKALALYSMKVGWHSLMKIEL